MRRLHQYRAKQRSCGTDETNTVATAMKTSAIEIAGAGPAGLAAAITLAHAGVPVVVHEAQAEVGYRFQRDLQGLENWSTEEDVLAVLRNLGIDTDFKVLPYRKGTVFDRSEE